MDFKIEHIKIIFLKILVFMLVFFFIYNIILTVTYAKPREIDYNKIDIYLKKQLEKAHIPGASVIFVDKDKVLFSNTYGNCENTNIPFILGSTSKSFTAVGIMQLVEKKKLNIDDSASKYLPKRNLDNKVTIKNLLNHTSGIGTYQDLDNIKVGKSYGKHVYSNLNYALLGEIIETISGISYEEYVLKNIFSPIGMTNSYTYFESGKKNGLIDGHRNYFGFMVPEDVPYPDGTTWASVSAGYIISSASDMGKYLQMYLRKGEDIISPSSINNIFYDGISTGKDTSYAMGWRSINKYKEPIVEHSGLVENYMSYMFILPESHIGCAILVNTNDYFVANNMMNTIGEGIVLSVFGENPEEVNSTYYKNTHIKFNLIYLIVFIISILPLILIRKWNNKIKKGIKTIRSLLLIHIVLPTVLIIFPKIIGVEMFVVKDFVPDLYIVLITSILILYLTGIIKLMLIWRKFRTLKP